MNDIEKSNIKRKNSGKRMRRRKRMMSVYVFVVILLVMSVGITMCFTFLFNIDEIVISGESEMYSYMQIFEATGIKAGDNLLRLDTKSAEQAVLDKLLYVESADIDRDFPSTLRINVTRCIPAYNIQHDKGVLLVSRKGKILADNNFYTDMETLPIIYGFDPKTTEAGTALDSKSANKLEAFNQLISRFDHDDNGQIASIDLTNEYDITVYYRNGIVFRMGNWSDVEYKLDLAQNVMEDESIQGKKGFLTMIGSKQCSFRSSGEQEMVVATTTVETDAEGNPVSTETTAVENRDDGGWYDDGSYYDDGSWYDDGGYYDDGSWYDNGYYDDSQW